MVYVVYSPEVEAAGAEAGVSALFFTLSTCPGLMLLLLSPFHCLSSLTEMPCLVAIADRVSPLFTVYVAAPEAEVPDADVDVELDAEELVDGPPPR